MSETLQVQQTLPKKIKKTTIFGLESYHMQIWNLGAMWVLMNALCKPSLGAPDHITKILQAENGQKVKEFEPIYLGTVITYRYWSKIWNGLWFLSTLSIVFFLVMFVYPTAQLKNYCIFLFSYCNLLLNSLKHCIQSLSDWRYQGGLVCDWNRGCQVEGIPLGCC